MTITTETLDPETREAIEHELHRCRESQSWAYGATRSSWTDELRAILDAETPEEVEAATDAAKVEQRRLATKVAERLIDVDKLRELLYSETDDDSLIEQLEHSRTILDLIKVARQHRLWIDQGNAGARDGWVLSDDEAVVYATMRSWVEDECDFVEINAEMFGYTEDGAQA